MNLLVVLHESSIYGANKSILELTKILSRKKFNVEFILPSHGSICKNLDTQKLQYSIVPFKNWVYYNWTSSTQVKSILKRIKFLSIGIINELRNKILLVKYKNYLNSKNIDFIISNSSATDFGHRISSLIKAKHVWFLREFLDLDYDLKFYFSKQRARRFILNSDLILGMSKSILNHFNIHEQKSLSVYEGINLNKYYPSTFENRFLKLKDRFGFVFSIVGLIRRNKGQLFALKAFKEFLSISKSKSLLLIVGEGNTAELDRYIKINELTQNVLFTGYIEQVSQIYSITDVTLMCSRNEAMGIVTLESMAHGVPVIGLNSGGTIELIKNNKSGFLVNDEYEFAEKMNLLYNNIILLENMKKEARNHIKQNYSMSQYSRNFIELLKSIKN
jgi:glycosyltransferase involved in cell wall biosynthesis